MNTRYDCNAAKTGRDSIFANSDFQFTRKLTRMGKIKKIIKINALIQQIKGGNKTTINH